MTGPSSYKTNTEWHFEHEMLKKKYNIALAALEKGALRETGLDSSPCKSALDKISELEHPDKYIGENMLD